MNRGIRIGRLFDIEFSLDYSWFLIFTVITLGLAFALFPQIIPGLGMATYLTMGIVTSVLFFASVLLHEVMHSLVAQRNGLKIERIRLMIFGGVSELTEEPHSPHDEFTMAIAGPLSSIALAVVFFGLFVLTGRFGVSPVVGVPAFWLGYINALLGVFNLLPGFPLDGGRVFRSALWYMTKDLLRATRIAANTGKAMAVVMVAGGALGAFLGNINLIWFALLGWYLYRAADMSYRQLVWQQELLAQERREEEQRAQEHSHERRAAGNGSAA